MDKARSLQTNLDNAYRSVLPYNSIYKCVLLAYMYMYMYM